MPMEFNKFNFNDCVFLGNSYTMDLLTNLYFYRQAGINENTKGNKNIHPIGPGTLMMDYFSEYGMICLGLYNHEQNMGISDLLSSSSDSIDRFIERKLKQAGHSLDEKNKVNINLNPEKDEIILKGQGALILKWKII